MKYHLEFTLDGLPPTLNRLNSMHYMAKARLNRDLRDAVMWEVGSHIPKKPLKRAKIKITRYSSTEPDGDNMTGGYKPIIDALRKCRVIENDKQSNIGNIETPWVKAPKNKGRIIVQVWEV